MRTSGRQKYTAVELMAAYHKYRKDVLEKYASWDKSLSGCVGLARPHGVTEFDIQAVLWHGLRELGYEVHGEVHMSYRSFADLKAVMDLAVYKNGELNCIVEVKKDREWDIPGSDGRFKVVDQAARYAMKARVYLVSGMQEAMAFLNTVRECGHMPVPTQLRGTGCASALVQVMSDYRFEWNGQAIFSNRSYP